MQRLKSIFSLMFVTLMLILPHLVFAQTGGGGSGGGSTAHRGELYLIAGALGISSGSTQVDAGPGFQFVPFQSVDWLQLGGEATYQKVSYRGSSGNNLLILAGMTANIGPNVLEAVFISLGFARRTGSMPLSDLSAVDPNGSGFYFVAGKRIPITGTVSLRPSLGMVSTGTSGMIFRPFAVSYMF
jgi:hypothetical protein